MCKSSWNSRSWCTFALVFNQGMYSSRHSASSAHQSWHFRKPWNRHHIIMQKIINDKIGFVYFAWLWQAACAVLQQDSRAPHSCQSIQIHPKLQGFPSWLWAAVGVAVHKCDEHSTQSAQVLNLFLVRIASLDVIELQQDQHKAQILVPDHAPGWWPMKIRWDTFDWWRQNASS